MRMLLCATLAACACAPAWADSRPDDHAPIGVMGDHTHKKGEWMFSYRFMQMLMEGNRDGTSRVSPQTIATTTTNRFANPPMMPPTLRVVPTKMTMSMHMLGAMYAPTNDITLMAMTNYIAKDMDHITFQGPAGSTELGTFTTRTSGIGDTTLAALISLPSAEQHRWHATVGVSLPTGSIDESDQILTPMNTRPSPRLPYPMQLGSGTFDLIGGLTYSNRGERWGWGAQWRSTVRTGENDENYTLGDEHLLQSWASYRLSSSASLSARIVFRERGNIDGIDSLIVAPVQTADPDRQGFDRLDAGLGLNVLVPGTRHRLALELTTPVRQNLDGPQLETDWEATVGWQLAL